MRAIETKRRRSLLQSIGKLAGHRTGATHAPITGQRVKQRRGGDLMGRRRQFLHVAAGAIDQVARRVQIVKPRCRFARSDPSDALSVITRRANDREHAGL